MSVGKNVSILEGETKSKYKQTHLTHLTDRNNTLISLNKTWPQKVTNLTISNLL